MYFQQDSAHLLDKFATVIQHKINYFRRHFIIRNVIMKKYNKMSSDSRIKFFFQICSKDQNVMLRASLGPKRSKNMQQ